MRENRTAPPTPYETRQPHRRSYRPHRHSRPIPSFPPPSRHSRESGNPHPSLSPRRGQPGFWIPACAGMTVGMAAAVISMFQYVGVWIPAFAGMTAGEIGMMVGPAQAIKSPLPAGEGWVRERRTALPTLYETRQPHRHSYRPHRHCHPPPVIPAPIPSFPRKRESTPRPIAAPGTTGVLDSGLRRNDGGDGGSGYHYVSVCWGVDSRFRGNDGGGGNDGGVARPQLMIEH